MKTLFVAIFMVMVVASVAELIKFGRGDCGENEVEDCEPCCPQEEVTCQNKVAQSCGHPCPLSCVHKCVCAKGYFRNTKSGKCVTDC
uniref:Chymotrypsin inhibitor Ani s 6-like isoform X1 n=1 Tax=Diabrotica virgifera virgifera TaxID=50390 RepID=A0A6P7GC87_DIAVI